MLPMKNIFFFLVFIVGGILLQIFLSKRKNKWPGLVLPIITFIFSLIWIFNIMAVGSARETIILVFITFFLTNIPTAILLAIYFSCQHKVKNNSN